MTIAITVEGEPGQLLVSICYLLSQKNTMETQDLLLMVLLLSPGLLLSVTIMLTFAAGGWINIGDRLPINLPVWLGQAPRLMVAVFGGFPLLETAVDSPFIKPEFRIFGI